MLNNHAEFNNWMVLNGNRISSCAPIESYRKIRSFTKTLKEDIGESLRCIIVEEINKQNGIIKISSHDLDTMIDLLPSMKDYRIKLFKEKYSEDIFSAFKYLHEITKDSINK